MNSATTTGFQHSQYTIERPVTGFKACQRRNKKVQRAGIYWKTAIFSVAAWLSRTLNAEHCGYHTAHGFPDSLTLGEKHRLGLYDRM